MKGERETFTYYGFDYVTIDVRFPKSISNNVGIALRATTLKLVNYKSLYHDFGTIHKQKQVNYQNDTAIHNS